ncbi:MAG TPA: hypothetical protein VKA14_00125 [Gammaproteobacteria bacterium]|nr:hypothetical protein [Gammaproteobacteria bacterium]
MTLDEFSDSLQQDTPPEQLDAPLRALWEDAKGDWEAAHRLAQNDPSAAGAWVHAYLHRKEGDLANAAYWYSRAGRPQAQGPLKAEWADIVRALLTQS